MTKYQSLGLTLLNARSSKHQLLQNFQSQNYIEKSDIVHYVNFFRVCALHFCYKLLWRDQFVKYIQSEFYSFLVHTNLTKDFSYYYKNGI